MHKKIATICLIIIFASFGFHALGQSGISGAIQNSPGINLSIQNVYGILVGLACWISEVAIAIMVIALIFYGIMFFVSQGNPQKLGDAKQAFLWGVVGILVILGTYTIIATVGNFLNPSIGYYNYMPINCSFYP